jgi:hypothetical protein
MYPPLINNLEMRDVGAAADGSHDCIVMHDLELFFADVFVPDLGLGVDVAGQELHAFPRGEVVDLDTVFAEPVDASLEGLAFSDDDGAEPELADKAGAVPARSERGDHDEVAVRALAAGVAEGVGLSMGGRVVVLDAAVVSRTEEGAVVAENSGSDGDASFGESLAGLGDGDGKHGVEVHKNRV